MFSVCPSFKQSFTSYAQSKTETVYYIFVQLGFSVSNWQKVQLNTDLFLDTQKYLNTDQMA